MGCSTDDERIPKAYEMAEEQGLAWHFSRNETETEVYPKHRRQISLTGVKGKKISLRGESVGGGKIRIARIDGIEVDFTGEYNTLIIVHKDKVGMAAHIHPRLKRREGQYRFYAAVSGGQRRHSLLYRRI